MSDTENDDDLCPRCHKNPADGEQEYGKATRYQTIVSVRGSGNQHVARVDRARAAIIAHARKGRESGWRGMESAPRDEQVWVVFEFDSGQVKVEVNVIPRGPCIWWECKPIAWQPLVAPPAPSSETGKGQGE